MATPLDGQLVRRSSGEHAALYIRRLIFDGVLRPGMRVPQNEIASALGISRIPVREALITLEHEGWVVSEMHRGAFIATLDERSVRDHYDLYGMVYGFAARRAVDRGPDDLGAHLTEIARAVQTATDPRELGVLSVDFHRTVVDAAATPRIHVVLRALASMVPGNFFRHVPEAVPVQRAGLTRIADAVSRGDGDAAASEYASMLSAIGDAVVRLFDARGLFDAEPVTEADVAP